MVRRVRLLVAALAIATVSSVLSGQHPNRRPEPYVAPLLPAESVWEVTLDAAPAAGGALDSYHVYVPLQSAADDREGESVRQSGAASVAALDRETGVVRWTAQVETVVPPVVRGNLVLVAASDEIVALSALTGFRQWSAPIAASIRAPMLLRGDLLVGVADPTRLVAFHIDTREVAWTLDVGEPGNVRMNADDDAVYVTTPGGRVLAVRLADGTVAWERQLEGGLSEPAVGGDRVLVGSTINALWALNPGSGKIEWHWDPGRIFGGDVIGAAVEEDVVYVASLDNILRALNRSNGNQRWKEEIGTRPVLPPQAFFGTVVITGLSPTVSTFIGRTGARVSTWSAPADAELQGPPLIDEYLKPYRVAMVIITRDGRVMALRPSAMAFTEPAAAPLTSLPGRPLPVERLPGDATPPTSRPFR